MGMFSTLIYEGGDYQFKTGFDDCLTFELGDTIPWQPDPLWPGSHIDGVHEGYGCNEAVWVVVKDQRIVGLEPWEEDPRELRERYGIGEPDRGLWTEEQWQANADRERRAEEKYQEWLKDHPNGDPISYFMHLRLQEPSFADRILPPLKEEAQDDQQKDE